MDNTPNTQPVSAGLMLADWANNEAGWIRFVVADLLATRRRPADSEIERYLELLLQEKQLATGPVPAAPVVMGSGSAAAAEQALILRKLTVKDGVNALKNNEGMTFGKSLTVVFGENGSGKSGYARILKRAAGVRSAERILGNVNQPGSTTPRAEVVYDLGATTNESLEWHDHEGIAPLTQICVFDSRAVAQHVDDDLAYLHIPGELAVFPLVQEVIDRVRTRLNERVTQSFDPRNPFVIHFDRTSSLYPLIERLGASSNLEHLKGLATLSDEDRARLSGLESEIDALRSGDVSAQLKMAEDHTGLLARVVSALAACEQLDLDGLIAARARLAAAQVSLQSATTDAFKNSVIPGVLTPSWNRFIEAGEAHLREIGRADTYPSLSEPCIYCNQPLLEAAVELVQRYRTFQSGEQRRTVDEAKRSVDAMSAALRAETIEATLSALDVEIDAGRGVALLPLRDALVKAVDFRAAITIEDGPNPTKPNLSSELNQARTIHRELTERISSLRSKATDRARMLAARQGDLKELRDRQKLSELWPAIEKRISDAKWADGANSVARSFTGTLRSLTETAKVAAEALLNTNFEQAFGDEVRALRAPTVLLQFPGARGQTVRRKVVGVDHRPGEVLSEGEQKVLALADFLAETRIRQPRGPVLFDDPVNSLDYKRVEEVAGRLVELAKSRQVIVFTHSIWLASLLLKDADRKVVAYLDIRNEGQPGVVTVGTHPRTDSVAELKKKVNERIAQAKKAETADLKEVFIESGYSILRSLCEVGTEKMLLKGVTERHRPNVMVDVLPKINLPDLGTSIAEVVDVYHKACRITEAHSQTMDQLGLQPTITDLEQDLARAVYDVESASGRLFVQTWFYRLKGPISDRAVSMLSAADSTPVAKIVAGLPPGYFLSASEAR